MTKGRKRVFLVFSLFLITLVMITAQLKGKGFPSFVFLSYPFDLLNRVTSGVAEYTVHFFNVFSENSRLRTDLSGTLAELQKTEEIREENRRLRALLHLTENTSGIVAGARVIARGYDRFLYSVVIDKGERDGIRKDMTVISVKGLAGKIVSSDDDFSRVLLIRDPNFSASVRLQKSRFEGVLSGTGHGYLILKYIPVEIDVSRGDIVITSGLDGMFPPGVPVGVISYSDKKSSPFFQHIEITPFQSDATLEEVVVLRLTGKRHAPVPHTMSDEKGKRQ